MATRTENGGGGNIGATGEKNTAASPSQRIVNRAAGGRGAALVIALSGVREVQQALNRLGYLAGPLTGNWDKATQRAMAQFQAAHGLSPNGNLTISAIAGLGLWDRLIGNPNGNGNKPLTAAEATGAPPPRGNTQAGAAEANRR